MANVVPKVPASQAEEGKAVDQIESTTEASKLIDECIAMFEGVPDLSRYQEEP